MEKIYGKFNSLPWLQAHTVFLTKHGSHAYGTNLPTSDLDVKGVAIPPISYFLGYAKQFEDLVQWAAEQDEELIALYHSSTLTHHPDPNKLDDLCESLVRKFFSSEQMP